MPAPRQRRVPDAYGRHVLRRLDQQGELEVLLGLLWDHADYLQEEIARKLCVPLTGEPGALADLQAVQGGFREVHKIANAWQTLARAPEPAREADTGSRHVVDVLTKKRARARL